MNERLWAGWKKSFYAWEDATARHLEKVMGSDIVLAPAGKLLGAYTKLRKTRRRLLAGWWTGWGLPSRQDQERTLHRLNELETRLLDMEERVRQARGSEAKTTEARPAGETEG